MKHKWILILIAILLIINIKLIYTYSVNNKLITEYSNHVYNTKRAKRLLVMNYQEPYIAHYNYGIVLYQTKDYVKAQVEFTKALDTVPEERFCQVSVNLALTEMELLDVNLSSEELINKIEAIQGILKKQNCASSYGYGKDRKAQELYNYLEELKKTDENQQNGNSSNNEESNEDEEVIPEESTKVDQIKNKKTETSASRNPANERDYDIDYRGKVW